MRFFYPQTTSVGGLIVGIELGIEMSGSRVYSNRNAHRMVKMDKANRTMAYTGHTIATLTSVVTSAMPCTKVHEGVIRGHRNRRANNGQGEEFSSFYPRILYVSCVKESSSNRVSNTHASNLKKKENLISTCLDLKADLFLHSRTYFSPFDPFPSLPLEMVRIYT